MNRISCKRLVRLTGLVVAVIAACGTTQAEMWIPTGAASHVHVAQMGMGGVTTTVATNAHTLFYNPAMLCRQSTAVEFSLPFGANTDVVDFVNFVNDNQDNFDNFENLTPAQQAKFLQDSQKFDNQWLGLQFSPYLGVIAHNLAFGAYGLVHSSVKVDQGVFSPAVGLRAYGDMVVALAYGFRPKIADAKTDMGVTLRYINRRSISPMRLDATDASKGDKLAKTIKDELSDSKSGFGLDVGAVRSLGMMNSRGEALVDVAAVVQDLVGSLDGWVKPNLKAGAVYHVPYGHSVWLKRWDVAADVVDLFNRDGVSYMEKLNFGTEVAVLAEFLRLRGGFHQGYPTYGLGLNFRVFKIDAARYTEELSTRPGGNPDDLYLANITIGW